VHSTIEVPGRRRPKEVMSATSSEITKAAGSHVPVSHRIARRYFMTDRQFLVGALDEFGNSILGFPGYTSKKVDTGVYHIEFDQQFASPAAFTVTARASESATKAVFQVELDTTQATVRAFTYGPMGPQGSGWHPVDAGFSFIAINFPVGS
jgi:hypothetical protein